MKGEQIERRKILEVRGKRRERRKDLEVKRERREDFEVKEG